MKRFLTTSILIFFTTQMFGQSFFETEGKQIKVDTYTKTYNFYYEIHDSLNLYLSDSIVTFSNFDSTIIKSTTYSKFEKCTLTNIQYHRTNKKDSISKLFCGDNLFSIYETRFDSLDRIVYYAMKDYKPDSHDGFEWFYEYRDSIISTGMISIQTIFVADYYGGKRFHFRVLSEYDHRKRKIKETRESQANDSLAQITTYSYNNNDSLISEKFDNMEMLQKTGKRINTNCDQENEFVFTSTNYSDIKKIACKLLNETKNILIHKKCENLIFSFISHDNQTSLIIVKRKPYYCEGRTVTFRTTRKL